VLGLLDHAGELLNQSDMAEVEKSTTPTALAKRMRECYLQLLRPEGSFMQSLMRKDPLGINSHILNRLLALSQGMGYNVQVKNGRFVHTDDRQLMMVLETSTSATSIGNSEALVNELNQIAAAAPPGVEIIPIGAQLHTVENQKLMQADTRFAGIINGVVFLLLFLLVSRDWRVGAIFLLPLLSIGLTIGLCALIHPSLSLMVIGVSLTMAGSAVDYGIFVYTAVSTSKDRQADLRRIRVAPAHQPSHYSRRVSGVPVFHHPRLSPTRLAHQHLAGAVAPRRILRPARHHPPRWKNLPAG